MNPIKAIREARGISRAEFAMMLGRSYNQLATIELGHARAIPTTWREQLEAAGCDFDQLSRDYTAWRSSHVPMQA